MVEFFKENFSKAPPIRDQNQYQIHQLKHGFLLHFFEVVHVL
jgi:hypothetical protein